MDSLYQHARDNHAFSPVSFGSQLIKRVPAERAEQ